VLSGRTKKSAISDFGGLCCLAGLHSGRLTKRPEHESQIQSLQQCQLAGSPAAA
jgi:hypothetical protein